MNQVVVVPGHLPAAPGATAANGDKEHDWQVPLAREVVEHLTTAGVPARLELREHVSYSKHVAQMNHRTRHDRLYVELHFNGSENARAAGAEVLVASQTSLQTKRLASELADVLASTVVQRDRGVLAREHGDRGGGILWGVIPPALIIETHFGSNPESHAKATWHRDEGGLGEAIAHAIAAWWAREVGSLT